MRPVRCLAVVIGPVVALAAAVPSAARVVAVKPTRPQTGPARSERALPGRADPATAGFAYVNPDGLLLAGALYDSAGGAVSANHVATGQYEVAFGKLGFVGGDVQLTPLTGLTCTVGFWGPSIRGLLQRLLDAR